MNTITDEYETLLNVLHILCFYMHDAMVYKICKIIFYIHSQLSVTNYFLVVDKQMLQNLNAKIVTAVNDYPGQVK